MDRFNILVVDEHNNYSNRLKTELEGKSGEDDIQVFWAWDLETINEIHVNYAINLYIVSEKWKGGSVAKKNAIVVPLIEERGAGTSASAIGRNDPMDRTTALILKLLKNHTRIIGVTGIGGGSGKTSVAIALACLFAMSGRKTFFLTLDPFIINHPFTQVAQTGFAEVIAALDVAEELEKTINSACVRQTKYPNVEAFAISEYNVDRAEAGPEDIARLLGAMKRMNRWDVIIVDLESRMDDRLFEIWQLASRMVMLIPDTKSTEEKLFYANRELQMRYRRGEADLRKLVPVLNFFKGEKKGLEFLGSPVGHVIENLNARADASMLSSTTWCELVQQAWGKEMFKPIFVEVAR